MVLVPAEDALLVEEVWHRAERMWRDGRMFEIPGYLLHREVLAHGAYETG